MFKGVALWNEAKTIIPGGSQLLSKRAEMFLPDQWPSYFHRAKGCHVWDIDGREFDDFSQMGVGSCILGYSDDDINQAVKQAIDDGSMCTLNSPEEVALAKKLISLHPWAQMVRFARSGGEVATIAVRIARAATGRKCIAFCGYHGWHDWYLSANLGDTSNLDGQLLPGLHPKGVPVDLRHTALPFYYNSLDELKDIVATHGHDLAAIVMEPVRSQEPENGFLEGVRALANQSGAVLIFDEITSGFRECVGGIHLKLNVNPDMALFGKALGNGFAISAVIGKKHLMDAAQESFISSTFWTERVGFVAGLATIEKIERLNVPRQLVDIGSQIKQIWQDAAVRNNLNISFSGILPLIHFSFNDVKADALMTLYTQEMLQRGFLAGSSVYASLGHNPAAILKFKEAINEVFDLIAGALRRREDILTLLKGPVKHTGFKRLT